MVELTRNDISDLREVSKKWRSTLGLYIASDSRTFINSGSYHFYALTKQKNNFEKLVVDDVLGLAEIKELDTFNRVLYIQTKPEYISRRYGCSLPDRICNSFKNVLISPFRKFKHIGKGMLDSVKDIFPDKRIELTSVDEAVGFYKKQDFFTPSRVLAPEKLVFNPKQ